MLERLQRLRDYLLQTLWFVPSLIVLGSIGLAVAMVEWSAHVDDEALARWPRIFGASAASSRAILSGVASGMITVAGLTFSLTMVAVTQASSQYTPRILRTLMADRPNQLILGTFVGIFAYCLVVLRTIRSADDGGTPFVPSLAVALGILLAMLGIGVLIYFVHHIASMLQASSIIDRVTTATARAIDTLFPRTLGVEADEDSARVASELAAVTVWHPVPARATGYVQRVDETELLDIAIESGRLVRMERAVGEFVAEGLPLASIAAEHGRGGLRQVDQRDQEIPAHRPSADTQSLHVLTERIAATFHIDRDRTIEQDAAFGIRQLVDVALRALSPGVNDTATAVSCVDYLGALLIRLGGRRIESPVRERDGTIGIIAKGASFEQLFRLSCDEIRQNAAGNVSILFRMLNMLGDLLRHVHDPVRAQCVVDQLRQLSEVGERTVADTSDKALLREAYSRAMGAEFPTSLPGISIRRS